MPTQNQYGWPVADPRLFPASTSFTTLAHNASNNGCGIIFAFEAGRGNLAGLGVLCTAVTSPPIYRLSLQGVASRLNPDGTVKSSGACAGTFTPTANTVHIITFGSSYAGTVNETLAGVLEYSSGTIGASNTATFAYVMGAQAQQSSPYAIVETAGVWALGTGVPTIVPIYADGTYGRRCTLIKSMATTTPNSSTNPLWYGNSFTPAFGGVFSGCEVLTRVQAGSNYTVSLFEGSNTTAVSSSTVTVDKAASTVGNGLPMFVPMPAYTLTAGTVYRLALSMTTATSFTNWFTPTFDSANGLQTLAGGMAGCTSPSSISWTDYNNGTNGYKMYAIYPCIDNYTLNAGGTRRVAL